MDNLIIELILPGNATQETKDTVKRAMIYMDRPERDELIAAIGECRKTLTRIVGAAVLISTTWVKPQEDIKPKDAAA